MYVANMQYADQLRNNWEADQRRCFRYTDSRTLGNSEDRFSQNMVHT